MIQSRSFLPVIPAVAAALGETETGRDGEPQLPDIERLLEGPLGMYLVPCVDLFNQAPSRRSRVGMATSTMRYARVPRPPGSDAPRRDAVVWTTGEMAYGAGEQVFLDYGQRPNHVLLAQYGFVLEDNADDYVEIRYEFTPPKPLPPPPPPSSPVMVDGPEGAGGAAPQSLRATTQHLEPSTHFEQGVKERIAVLAADLDEVLHLRAGGFRHSSLAAMRILHLGPGELTAHAVAMALDSLHPAANGSDVLTFRNEMETAVALHGACRDVLGSYPPETANDDATLRAVQLETVSPLPVPDTARHSLSLLTPVEKAALIMRVGEKRLLANCLE